MDGGGGRGGGGGEQREGEGGALGRGGEARAGRRRRRRRISWRGLLSQTRTAKPRMELSVCGLIRAASLMSRARAGPGRKAGVPGDPAVPRRRDSGPVTCRRWKSQRTPFGFSDNYPNSDLSALRRFVSGSPGEKQRPKPSLSPPGCTPAGSVPPRGRGRGRGGTGGEALGGAGGGNAARLPVSARPAGPLKHGCPRPHCSLCW